MTIPSGSNVEEGAVPAGGPQQPTAGPPVEPEQDPGARRRAGLRATVADMIRSMLVILAIVAVIVLLVPRPSAVPQQTVDVASAATAAAKQVGFAPAVGVPSGWTVTSTRVRRDTSGLLAWNVNYVTAQGKYAGLEQVAGWSEQWQASLTQGGAQQGTVTIAGREWTRFVKADREIIGLLLREPDRSTLVLVKSGEDADGRLLAESLGSGV